MRAETDRWVTGDQFGLVIPADPVILRSGGTQFLTDAFRAAGILVADNAVTNVTDFRKIARRQHGTQGRPIGRIPHG